MQLSNLSLRQRRLIDYFRNHPGYTTGTALASHLGVSSRTIRSEISETNPLLVPYHIQIKAKHGYGYTLEAEDPAVLADLARSNISFLTREDRIRHILTKLCLSDTFTDLYDFQDEMFISQTTLENDLIALREYCDSFSPHIQLLREHNSIRFEADERKKRAVLTHLITDNWNYHARGNTYYHYHFLDEVIIDRIMAVTRAHTEKARIYMDDINMVILNLSIAIAGYRLKNGHALTDAPLWECKDLQVIETADSMLDELEGVLSVAFPENERKDIYLHISFSRLHDADKLNFRTVSQFFDSKIILITDQYLHTVMETFHMNFFQDQDFYITLLQCIYFFSLPISHFNPPDVPPEQFRAAFCLELEIACLFQDMAKAYFGRYLTQNQLFYLAFCLHGAMGCYLASLPKINTVILCQLNLPACWYLKRQLESNHGQFLHIQALLPVYRKDSFDFSQTDLILTTANKTIQKDFEQKTLHISPYFSREDSECIDSYVSEILLGRMVSSDVPSIAQLFRGADWIEDCTADSYEEVQNYMISRQIERGNITERFRESVQRRSKYLPYPNSDAIVLIHSLEPAQQTHLSVCILKHRVRCGSLRLRYFFLLTVRPEHACVLFLMQSLLSRVHKDAETLHACRTRADLLRMFELDSPQLPL